MDAPTAAQRTRSTRVIGIAAWTTNAAEADPSTATIPKLWNRFTHEDWFARLDGIGALGPTIAVYCDYETDVSGRYRILLGREIDGEPGAGTDLGSVQIPSGRYLVFRVTGPMPQAVIDGWRRVWAFFAEPEQAQRAYTVDLEVYHADGTGIELWIAVR